MSRHEVQSETTKTLLDLRSSKGILNIFDVDDTLFHTKARIKVIKDGEVIRFLSSSEYNDFKLGAGQSFDYSEFRCSKTFAETSKPIQPIVNTLIRHQKKVMRCPLSRTIIVTAREDFNCRDTLVEFFQRHGIDIDNEVYVERSGNLSKQFKWSTAESKKVVFDQYLSTGVYHKVRLWDDAIGNIRALLELQSSYPEITFESNHVRFEGEQVCWDRYTRLEQLS